MLLQPLPVSQPERLVNFAAPGPQSGIELVQPGRRLRRGLQLPDVPRPREGEHGLQRHRRRISCSASTSRCPGQTPVSGDGVFVSGSYFPVLGHSTGARPPADAERRQDDRRTLRGRAELRVLGNAARRESERPRPADHDQRAADDDHRRRAQRVSPARRSARGPTCSSRSRCAA